MSRLLQPLVTPRLELKNRLVMPPMATSKADIENGHITAPLLDYYAEKTKSGAFGLVITEHFYIARQGMNRPGQPSAAADVAMEGMERLAQVIKRDGTKAVVQINHAGGASSASATGEEVVSASDVPGTIGAGETPRPLSREEIGGIVARFGEAAARVKAAGFDGVEIHAAHGYLLNQFFSPLTNRRTDEYGGELLGRIRFHLEVIAAVRDAVGPDFPVLLRLGAIDYGFEGGSTVDDSVAAAIEFERAGVDVLDITGGMSGYVRPGHDEPGYFAEASHAIREAVSIPVILTGGVTEPQHAEQLLAEGKADLIGVGRAVLKDSGWAARAVRELSRQ